MSASIALIVGAILGGLLGWSLTENRWLKFADREQNVPCRNGYFSVRRRRGPIG